MLQLQPSDSDIGLKMRPSRRRSTVTFSPKLIIYRYDISDSERQEWFNDEDVKLFRAETRKEVAELQLLKMKTWAESDCSSDDNCCDGSNSINTNDLEERHDLCIVGLEKLLISAEFTNKRERIKERVKRAVLGKQGQTKAKVCAAEDFYKADRIAEAARQYSKWSTSQAKVRGNFQYIQSKR